MKNKLSKKEPNTRGQALVETLLVIVILTAMAFAALQLCLVVVDDMVCNEAAFSSVRTAVVSCRDQGAQQARQMATLLLIPHSTRYNLAYGDTRLWNNTIAGRDIRDHGGAAVLKYNTNIEYRIFLTMASLLKPSAVPHLGPQSMHHIARARMVKSPDEEYYFKAYPHAPLFSQSTHETGVRE